jgi:hypothetical protein
VHLILSRDVLVIVSTYGDRLHPKEDLETKLTDIVVRTDEKGGTLIIPSFAVELTLTLMCLIWKMKEKGAIPDAPMIMDSPMGLMFLRFSIASRNGTSCRCLSAIRCVVRSRSLKITRTRGPSSTTNRQRS